MNYNTFSDTKESERNPRVGDKLVSVLPCWHIFERTAEYWMYSKGIHVVYSNVKNFKGDLAKVIVLIHADVVFSMPMWSSVRLSSLVAHHSHRHNI